MSTHVFPTSTHLQAPHPCTKVHCKGKPTEHSKVQVRSKPGPLLWFHAVGPLHRTSRCCDQCCELQAPTGEGDRRNLFDVGESNTC